MEFGFVFYWPPYSSPYLVLPDGGNIKLEVEGYIPSLSDVSRPTYEDGAAAPSVVEQRELPDFLASALGARNSPPTAERSSPQTLVTCTSPLAPSCSTCHRTFRQLDDRERPDLCQQCKYKLTHGHGAFDMVVDDFVDIGCSLTSSVVPDPTCTPAVTQSSVGFDQRDDSNQAVGFVQRATTAFALPSITIIQAPYLSAKKVQTGKRLFNHTGPPCGRIAFWLISLPVSLSHTLFTMHAQLKAQIHQCHLHLCHLHLMPHWLRRRMMTESPQNPKISNP